MSRLTTFVLAATLHFSLFTLHCFSQGVITTVAGSEWIFPAGPLPATNAPLAGITGVAVDAAGNVFATDDGNRLAVKFSPTGVLTVVAGNGIFGFSGDGGPATSASLSSAVDVAVDAAGNLYIADYSNNRIRKVSAAGIISTVAGNGVQGFSGDGGPATSASLQYPFGVAVDAAGNLYIADTVNHRIRKVSAAGIISTVAGSGVLGFSGDGGPASSASLSSPFGAAVDAAGNLYIADRDNDRIRKVSAAGIISTVAGNGVRGFSGDGGPATGASFNGPTGVAVDAAGNLYIADWLNHRIRKVSSAGIISTVAGNGVRGFSGDGGWATSASLQYPFGVAVDAAGTLHIAHYGRVRKISSGGIITTVAGNGLFKFGGDGGPATSGSLNLPHGVAVDEARSLYIADRDNNRIRKVSTGGIITTVAGNGTEGFSGDGGSATGASLDNPWGVAVDAGGNLYIADSWNHRVRKVGPAGIITTVAGSGATGWGAGRFSGDSGPATSASLSSPQGVALDAAGNLYIADSENLRIRKVSAAGNITTVAGNGVDGFSGDGGPATSAALGRPDGVAVDAAGNLYIADTENDRIRKVSPAGIITTVAGNGVRGFSGDGGRATSASLRYPEGVAVDAAGNLYIADWGNDRIRKVSPSGIITTVAGEGSSRFSGDGGAATNGSLKAPMGVDVHGAGNLYIADTWNDRIRKVLLAAAPTFSVAPGSLSFSATAGSAAPAPQQITLSSSVAGLAWQVTVRSGGNWLSVSPTSGQIPATVSASADASSLATGTYQGSIEISAPAASPSLATIAVTFTVAAAQPPSLSVEPSSLSFQVLAAAAAPPAQSVRIENAGGGTLSWTATAAAVGGGWLAISPASGSTPARLQVSVNPVRLAAGSYSGCVTVASAATNQSVAVSVSLRVSPPVWELLLSQSGLLFRAVEAGGTEPPQTFGVLNVGSGTADWSAEATAAWLRLSPSSGRSDAGATTIPPVTVSVDATGLQAGFYVGLLRVTSPSANNSPQVLRVDLQVLPRGAPLGAVVRPTGLIFVAAAGSSSPGSQDVRVATPESSPIEFLSQPIGGAWVTRAPDSATASRDNPGRIVVQPELGTLAAGIHRAGLTVFTRNDGVQHPVSLLFLVLPAGTATTSALNSRSPGALACTPSQLLLQFASLFTSFNATVGWPNNVLLNARDDCGNSAPGGTVTLSFSSGDPALTLTDLKNGQYQGVWRPNSAANPLVAVTARGLWRGLQGQATATAQVGLNPNAQANILSQGGVVLTAGYERGPVAPGSIISLFGQKLASAERLAPSLPLPKTLSGVRVLIGDKEAPLFYVGPGQVNAQVPLELAADRQLQVVVETNGVPSAPEPLQTAVNRPGIFILPQFGKQGAILIANTNRLAMPVTANVPSEPVPAGGFISIYCSGLGPTDPAVGSGEAGPATSTVKTPVTVTIGGQTATVTFAGLAPGFAGVYQVNAQVPAGVTPGNAVPVLLTQGSFQSNIATIAVK